MHDDVAKILEDVALNGWDNFDSAQLAAAQKRDVQSTLEARRKDAAPVGAALNSAAGDVFIRWLIDKTHMAPPTADMSSAQSAEMYAIAAARWEGRMQVVTMIREALAVARNTDIEP